MVWLSRQVFREAASLIARHSCSRWAGDGLLIVGSAIVPEVPPVDPAPGADGDVEFCANATLLTSAAAATIIIVLYMCYSS